jgi:hypothetical protein
MLKIASGERRTGKLKNRILEGESVYSLGSWFLVEDLFSSEVPRQNISSTGMSSKSSLRHNHQAGYF